MLRTSFRFFLIQWILWELECPCWDCILEAGICSGVGRVVFLEIDREFGGSVAEAVRMRLMYEGYDHALRNQDELLLRHDSQRYATELDDDIIFG